MEKKIENVMEAGTLQCLCGHIPSFHFLPFEISRVVLLIVIVLAHSVWRSKVNIAQL